MLVFAEYASKARGAGAGFGSGRASKGSAGGKGGGVDHVQLIESRLRMWYLPRALLVGEEAPGAGEQGGGGVPFPDEDEYVSMVGAGADHVRLLGLTADAASLTHAERAQLMEPPYEPEMGEMVLYLAVSVDGSAPVFGADIVRRDADGALRTRAEAAP